jgi:serine/threonine protein kinase
MENNNIEPTGIDKYNPNDMVGEYLLRERLGGGDYTSTFRGVNKVTQEIVAIKVFTKSSSLSISLYESEIKAYEALMGLSGILQLKDKGENDQVYFIVTEFIQGGSLRNILENYPEGMNIEDVIKFFTPIADAIDSIHGKNIIHRDLKPENILCRKTDNGYEIFVTDFSLVKFTTDSKLFKTETIAGTPSYIAPEAFTDASKTSAVDVYAFGLMIYEALEGKRPFEQLLDVFNKPIPYPERTRQKTNEKVVEHILRALSKSPEERPLSAKEIIDNIKIAVGLGDTQGWIGRQFNKYIVENILGEGKMGTSLLARDISTNTYVVLKAFDQSYYSSTNVWDVFEREVKILQMLETGHHVLVPQDIFKENGISFIVTEYKAGGNLRELLQRNAKSMELEDVLDIFTQIAEAIDYLHDRNIIHRDLKPENIVYDYYEDSIQVFITDFGISEVITGTRSSFYTKTTAGTFHYMAPESWNPSAPKTKAIDIYSFGIMLYEALEGRIPFKADFPAIMYQHLETSVPRPKKTIRNWGENAGNLMLQPLAKKPSERPKSAYKFMVNLKREINNSSLQKFTTEKTMIGPFAKTLVARPTCFMYLALFLLTLVAFYGLFFYVPVEQNNFVVNPVSVVIVFSLVVAIWALRNPLASLITNSRDALIELFSKADFSQSIGLRGLAWIKNVVDQVINRITTLVNRSPQKVIIDDSKIRLRQDFQYLHEPISFMDNNSDINQYYLARYIEHEKNEEEKFTNRLLFSNGGAFLLAGYRGVGKTSFINKAIYDLKKKLNNGGSVEVVDIHLSLARHVTPAYLMFLVIRNLYFRLREKNIFSKLSPSLQDEILLAYQRTMMNIGGKVNQNSEYGLSLGDMQILGILSKFGVDLKKSKGREISSSFLPYDDKQAEHDIISLSRKLLDGYSEPSNPYIKNLYHLVGLSIKNTQLKIICVLDELDKLDESTQANEESDISKSSDLIKNENDGKSKEVDGKRDVTVFGIIRALKNVFTTSGISFVFIAGKELHEKVIEDIRRGESIYESVFAFDKYLPVLWSKTEAICTQIMERIKGDTNKEIIEKFIKYLDFEGRGIPRRILRTFNKYVNADETSHILEFTRIDARRIRFYSGLLDDLKQENFLHSVDVHNDVEAGINDKQQLSAFYLVDWIFQQGNNSFTVNDVVKAGHELNQNILLSPNRIDELSESLIAVLKRHKYIKQIQAQTLYSMEQAVTPQYIISRRKLAELSVDAVEFEDDKTLIGIPDYLKENKIGDYRLLEHISTNSLTNVYRARDTRTQSELALKVMKKPLLSYEKQLRNEEKLLLSLNHPNLVKCYPHNPAYYEEIKDYPFIVMEYLDGVSLSNVIPPMGFDNYIKALSIFMPLVEVVNYLHQQNIVRCDIKPSNVILAKDGRILLIDLGTAKGINDHQESDRIIGTPAYISPEQLDGCNVDSKSDIYSLGILLVELITGAVPFQGETDYEILSLRRKNPNPNLTKLINKQDTLVPQRLKNIIRKCVEDDPLQRFNDVSELLNNLHEFPVKDFSTFVEGVIENEERFKNSENMATAEIDASYFSFVGKAPEPSNKKEKNENKIPRPGLRVSMPGQDDLHVPLKGVNEYLIGRSKHADLRPEYPSNHLFMSRYNSMIREEDGEYVIYDLNALNGTRINGKPIEKHILVNRDSIEISDNVSIRFFK